MEDLTRLVFSREGIALLGNVFSMMGFVLTIFVLFDTRKLRGFYRMRVRGPSLLRDLSKSASTLSDYLDDLPSCLPQIGQKFGKVEVKLRSIERNVGGRTKKSVKQARLYVDQCEVNAQNEEQVRRTYIEIIKVIEELKDHQKDLDWES